MSAEQRDERREALAVLAGILRDAATIRGREITPQFFSVATPAAGAEWSVRVPGGVVWSIQAIRCTLVTSGVAGTRGPSVVSGDGNVTPIVAPAAAGIATTTTANMCWLKDYGAIANIASAARIAAPWPAVPVFGGTILASSTASIDAADQYSAVSIFALELSERSYTVEAEYDLAALLADTSNAVPELREWL